MSADTDYNVIFTETAKAQSQRILDYLFFELESAQAAYSVEQDMKETTGRLSYVAGSLKLCENPKLRALEYRTIHFRHHKYFMLYKITGKQVYVVGVYHDLQDYEQSVR